MNLEYLLNHKTRLTAYLMVCGILLITAFCIFQKWYLGIVSLLIQVPIFIIFLKRYGEITGQYVKHFLNVFLACCIIYLVEMAFAGLLYLIYFIVTLI